MSIDRNSAELSPTKRALVALEKMQARLDAFQAAKSEPIAIVGMGCRFPGGASDPESYWKLLHGGVDTVREVPGDRWDVDAFYNADPDAPGSIYAREGAFIEDVDKFDASFFGISPREALSLDPQQRLLLEVCWEALEHAGIAPASLKGTPAGVFVGVMENHYAKLHLAQDPRDIDAYYVTGNHLSFAAGRVAFHLGLQGPAIATDTACSSSLVAMHLACQSLRSGESSLALAGGVNLLLSPDTALSLCRFKALSADGRCKVFDASADGFGQGEGCGIIVLKRQSDAVAAGDTILAEILGSAVNHDGASAGLTVPNGTAQQALVRTALSAAKLGPEDIDYVEAHGTGTSLGDPIEIHALDAVFGDGRNDPLLVGSVKANIGHLESAAGVAGVIKVVLAMQHGAVPGNIHLKQLNPHIALRANSIDIPKVSVTWPGKDRQRRAGVSSFGLSGTNAHVILQSPPMPTPDTSQEPVPESTQLLTLSAKSEGALTALAREYADCLSKDSEFSLSDGCYTANIGRNHFENRIALVAGSKLAARDLLDRFASGDQSKVYKGRARRAPQVAFLFTGQGSQYPQMGRGLYESEPTFRKSMDRCNEILLPEIEQPLLSILYPEEGSRSNLINETVYTQPALFALEYSLASLYMSFGIVPQAVMGHSVGEYVAATVAGVFSLEVGLKLIAERARRMQSLPSNGLMAAIFAPEEQVSEVIADTSDRVSIAAVNGPGNIVVSGEKESVEQVVARFTAWKLKAQTLVVSHAFHSPLMDPILDGFEAFASQFSFAAPKIPIISNVFGRALEAGEVLDAGYWRAHIRSAVQFSSGIGWMREAGFDVFFEMGPQPTLTGMAKRCVADAEQCSWIASLASSTEDRQQMLGSLAEAFVQGVEVDWKEVHGKGASGRHRAPLPTYPFQRERFWLKPSPLSTNRSGGLFSGSEMSKQPPLLGARLPSPLTQIQFESSVSPDHVPFLLDHSICGSIVFPATAYLEMALAAASNVYADREVRIRNVRFLQALTFPDDEDREQTLQLVLQGTDSETTGFEIYSLTDNSWTRHVQGELGTGKDDISSGKPSISLTELRSRFERTVDVARWYAELGELGLEYGPTFRGIAEAWQAPNEILGRVELNIMAGGRLDDAYVIHPALLDAAFQLSLMLGEAANDDGAESDVFLPVGIENFEFYRVVSNRAWGHVVKRCSRADEDGVLTVDLALFDEDGEIGLIANGLQLRKFSRQNLRNIFGRAKSNPLYEITWNEEAVDRDIEDVDTPAEGNWLIFADANGIGDALTNRLRGVGGKCFVVRPGKTFREGSDDESWRIDPSSLQDFQQLLYSIGGRATGLKGVVYLWGVETSADQLGDQRSISEPLLHLVKSLAVDEDAGNPKLLLVTRGTQNAGIGANLINPHQATIWGMGSAIVTEHSKLACSRVDLDPSFGPDEAEPLFRELISCARESQVAIREGSRFVPKLAPFDFSKHQGLPDKAFHIDSKASYLITGGLGGIGLKVAEWLANEDAGRVVLMGRGAPDSSTQEVIERLRLTTTEIVVARGDVSVREDIAGALASAEAQDFPLKGVIHAAGVLDDGVLLRQDWARFEKVFAPKVAGAWNLHDLTRESALDFFVLFSSTASIIGPAGQSNYAAANAFMDALAHSRRLSGMPGLVINWGPWSEVGMVARLDQRDQERLEDQGFSQITPTEGVDILSRLLAGSACQVVVLPVDWPTVIRSSPAIGAKGIFESMASSESAHSNDAELQVTKQQIGAAAPQERAALLQEALRAMVAETLKAAISDIDVALPLTDIGVDSLMALEVFGQIEQVFGHSISAESGSSIMEISNALAAEQWSSVMNDREQLE